MSSCVDAVNERDVKGMQIKILYTMLSYTKSFFVNGIQSNIHKENIYNEIDLVEFVILDIFSKFNLGAWSIHDLIKDMILLDYISNVTYLES